jgi:hypothetical protein
MLFYNEEEVKKEGLDHMHYLIKIEDVIQEYQFAGHVIIQSDLSENSAVHNYFKDYWKEGTKCIEKANKYEEIFGEGYVKIIGVREIPEEDALVLEKYMDEFNK